MSLSKRLSSRLGRRLGRRLGGNATLELALVMPLLLMLALGTAEYGYYFYMKHTLQGAAREGCRVAITPCTNSDVTAAVQAQMNLASIAASKYQIKIESPLGTATDISTVPADTTVYVTVQATWSAIGLRVLPPNMGGIGPTKLIVATTAMRKE